MRISKIPFDKIRELSFKDVFYQTKTQQLNEFIKYLPSLEGLKKATIDRNNYPVDRKLLVEVLQSQAAYSSYSSEQKANINSLLDDKTYTIITAHQPILLGGPAYYFYKIFSAINLAKRMAEEMPGYHFVPVFINGAEDHDFEEVKNIHLFGKSVSWNHDEGGAVGRFTTDNLEHAINEVGGILGSNELANELKVIWKESLELSNDYNSFVSHWLNKIIGKYGVIIANMDNPQLKRAFIPIIKQEILDRKSFDIVSTSQENLGKLNFKPQAFVREINIFYFTDTSRERIVFEQNKYSIHNTDITFTEDEIIEELETYPEKFSPNVVVRPLYQEYIWPNICYIGGGGEIAYWLERKSQFEHYSIFYPALVRRNSITIIPKNIQNQMSKLGLTEEDILLEEEALINRFIQKSTSVDIDLSQESLAIQEIFALIAGKAKSIDETLPSSILAESSKIGKSIESFESRLKRTIKQKEEVSINQIRNIKAKLFPNNGLQERKESFWQYYINEEVDFVDALIKECNPLQKEFLFLYL